MESTNTTEASLILDLDTNPKSSQIYNSVMERKHNKSNKVQGDPIENYQK